MRCQVNSRDQLFQICAQQRFTPGEGDAGGPRCTELPDQGQQTVERRIAGAGDPLRAAAAGVWTSRCHRQMNGKRLWFTSGKSRKSTQPTGERRMVDRRAVGTGDDAAG